MKLSGDESTITLSPKGVNFIVPPYKATGNWKPYGWIPQ